MHDAWPMLVTDAGHKTLLTQVVVEAAHAHILEGGRRNGPEVRRRVAQQLASIGLTRLRFAQTSLPPAPFVVPKPTCVI